MTIDRKPPFVRRGSVAINGVKVGGVLPAGQVDPILAASNVDFDLQEFDALLADKGYQVLWERAAFCPNRPPGGVEPLAHDVNCRVCDGTAFVFFAGTPTKMLIQAVTVHQQFSSGGRWDTGMVRVTSRPGFPLSHWDRITLLTGSARFTELLRRQPIGDDFPRYSPLCIEYAAWVDRSRQLQVFDPSLDLSANASGTITWGANRPDGGAYYTISYRYHPRYVVQDLPHQHRDSTIVGTEYPFPTQAVAKADFLIRDESRDSPQVRDEDPFKLR